MDKEQSFETEVLTRLAVIESKLDGYKEIKKVTYENENRSKQNTQEIQELKQRIQFIEEKPSKRWESVVTTIITGVAMTILGFVLAKLGLG